MSVATVWSRQGYDALRLSDAELRSSFDRILTYYQANGEMPTHRQMMVLLGLSSTSVVGYRLNLLAEHGYLERRPNGYGYRIPPAHLRIEYVGG